MQPFKKKLCGLLFLVTTANALSNPRSFYMECRKANDSIPFNKVVTIADSTGLKVQLGFSQTKISPYGIEYRLDSLLNGYYPLVFHPAGTHPDNVPFLFNMSSSDQWPYSGKNNVMMFGWNLGYGGGNFIPERPGIGFSLESNYHPGGDANTTWVESHEFYIKPSGQQVRLQSYTVGVAPGTEFIDFYHTTDNFHLRSDNQVDYYTVQKNKTTGSVVMNLLAGSETNMIIGRTDVPQSLQFQVLADRVNLVGQSRIIALPGTTELYLNPAAIGGINTGYGLYVGSGINGIGEMGERQAQYQFYANNTVNHPDLAVMAVGNYSGNLSGKQNSLVVYNNGTVTVQKIWTQYSGKASLEVGKKTDAKTPLKLDGLPTYASNALAIADGLEAGCLYIRTGHGLDVVVPDGSAKTQYPVVSNKQE
jgi:hypothetical protein